MSARSTTHKNPYHLPYIFPRLEQSCSRSAPSESHDPARSPPRHTTQLRRKLMKLLGALYFPRIGFWSTTPRTTAHNGLQEEMLPGEKHQYFGHCRAAPHFLTEKPSAEPSIFDRLLSPTQTVLRKEIVLPSYCIAPGAPRRACACSLGDVLSPSRSGSTVLCKALARYVTMTTRLGPTRFELDHLAFSAFTHNNNNNNN